MQEIVTDNPVDRIVEDIADYIAAKSSSEVHIGLTGGRSGGEITRKILATCGDNPRLHLWFSDERFVPRGDSLRNDADIDATSYRCHIHSIPTCDDTDSPTTAALAYSATLHQVLTTRFCSDNTLMDICLLSIGEDGHIASLFPRHAALDDSLGVVGMSDSPKPPAERVTWTYPTINASRQVWLIATGSSKANAVTQLTTVTDFHELPAAGVHGKQETRLYVDVEASSPA